MTVKKGDFTDSEIIVMLGENGTGKTTFIRMMAGILQPDSAETVPQLNVSYKPQKISPKSQRHSNNMKIKELITESDRSNGKSFLIFRLESSLKF